MSNNPEERNRDSKNAEEHDMFQPQPEPVDKQDPTEPVQVKGGKAKASADVGRGAAAATGTAGK